MVVKLGMGPAYWGPGGGLERLPLGCLVVCRDGSYVLKASKDGLSHETLACGTVRPRRRLRLVALECVLPTHYIDQGTGSYHSQVNDAVLICEVTGDVFFAMSRSLERISGDT